MGGVRVVCLRVCVCVQPQKKHLNTVVMSWEGVWEAVRVVGAGGVGCGGRRERGAGREGRSERGREGGRRERAGARSRAKNTQNQSPLSLPAYHPPRRLPHTRAKQNALSPANPRAVPTPHSPLAGCDAGARRKNKGLGRPAPPHTSPSPCSPFPPTPSPPHARPSNQKNKRRDGSARFRTGDLL